MMVSRFRRLVPYLLQRWRTLVVILLMSAAASLATVLQPWPLKFLVDYVTNFRQAFVAGEFYDFPCFAKTVPDINKLIANDPKAHPADKYKVLDDVLEWATNVGYPGYSNAAIDEIFGTWVLNVMFAKAAAGKATPEDALKEAEVACRRIFAKWKDRGLV